MNSSTQRATKQLLSKLHNNYMGIEKMRLLTCESICWIGLHADIENHYQNCSTCLEFQQIQPKERLIYCEVPGRLRRVGWYRCVLLILQNLHLYFRLS